MVRPRYQSTISSCFWIDHSSSFTLAGCLGLVAGLVVLDLGFTLAGCLGLVAGLVVLDLGFLPGLGDFLGVLPSRGGLRANDSSASESSAAGALAGCLGGLLPPSRLAAIWRRDLFLGVSTTSGFLGFSPLSPLFLDLFAGGILRLVLGSWFDLRLHSSKSSNSMSRR